MDRKLTLTDEDPLNDLGNKKLESSHAFCFYKDKMVIVYAENKGNWTPPGGGIEKGETYEEAVIREVKEETNMRVVKQKLIGYQDIFLPDRSLRQTRSVCIVEPYGDFVADPDSDITEIKLIDPKDYKQYFDWGEIGDQLMEEALSVKESI